ncbi:hypothetical protein AALP_AA6G330800 [Arabis alpina]|uniref:Uncharacterized protein n=1 Tax=Arabis alpina TaxID=50452 RepID=A0A087GT95_ARAAL|nr:hypothetical protein AALP_AA6G330800 [Arabis alpina]
MDPQASTPARYIIGDEEWELCNDDGFIYKRRKETIAGESSNPPDPELDPEEEERNRKKRKRKILLKLKRKYQKEIDHWDILSNTLCALQEKSKVVSSLSETRVQIEKVASSSSIRPLFLDELLIMEEAREGFIKNVSSVCEVAEGICRVEEEEEKEMFFNLPVWGTPQDLMESLCYD